jgi:hypothetical protein
MHDPSRPDDWTQVGSDGFAQPHPGLFPAPAMSMRERILYLIAYPTGLSYLWALVCSQSLALIIPQVSTICGLLCRRLWELTIRPRGLVLVRPGRNLVLSSQGRHRVYLHLTMEYGSLSCQHISSRPAPMLLSCYCPSCIWLNQDTKKRVVLDQVPEEFYF